MKKYIVIEKKVIQEWYSDGDTYIIRKDQDYIVIGKTGIGCDLANELEEIVKRDVEQIKTDRVEVLEFDPIRCINNRNYIPFLYDRTNDEYVETHYIRVYETEEEP